MTNTWRIGGNPVPAGTGAGAGVARVVVVAGAFDGGPVPVADPLDEQAEATSATAATTPVARARPARPPVAWSPVPTRSMSGF